VKKTAPFLLVIFIFLVTALFAIPSAFAAGSKSGGHSLGIGFGITSAVQKDLNSIIDSVNTSAGANTKNVNSAYEFSAQYAYRFSGSIFGLVFRPSYFTASGKGTNAAGSSYNHELTGYTFFPLLRIYPLENSFIRFYMQAGLGYGYLGGRVVQGTNEMKYSGSNLGEQAGLGADFCFTPNHCMAIEGNFRYLPIERNSADSLTGTMTGFTQAQSGKEVEYSGNDMSTTMSGIQGSVSYIFNF
jgi:hypothetical protein